MKCQTLQENQTDTVPSLADYPLGQMQAGSRQDKCEEERVQGGLMSVSVSFPVNGVNAKVHLRQPS